MVMIKRFVYGTLPYVACLLFKRDSVNLTYYRYIHRHGYRNHLYEFREEYEAMRVEVRQDAGRNLPYVINRQGRRLYFKRGTSVDKIERMYRALVMEQDPRSPHHYLDCTDGSKRIYLGGCRMCRRTHFAGGGGRGGSPLSFDVKSVS